MRKIAPATQRKNEKYILNLLNTQGNDLQDMNGEGTFFTALLSESGNQQVKIFLINGARNSKDWPNLSHWKKILTLYGEGDPTIGPSQTLILDVTVCYKVLVKKLTTEDVQTGFTDGYVVY